MASVQLSVEESLKYAQTVSWWDGFCMGAQAAAEHAKQTALNEIMMARKQAKMPPLVAEQQDAAKPVNGVVR